MTFQELINRVLIAVGQGDDQVNGVSTDTYHLKIAQFVNDILQEVEGAAPWRSLHTRINVTISAGGVSGTVPGANERSTVVRINNPDTGQEVPLVFDITDESNQAPLSEIDTAELKYLDQINNNELGQTGIPQYFALDAGATGLTLYVFPRADVERTIQLDLVVPQSPLDASDTDDLATAIKVPTQPVVYGATWWAMEDRGEELGPRGEKAEARYRNLLAEAVARELASQGLDSLVPQ